MTTSSLGDRRAAFPRTIAVSVVAPTVASSGRRSVVASYVLVALFVLAASAVGVWAGFAHAAASPNATSTLE